MLLRNIEKCHKWIMNNIKLILLYFIVSIILLNQNEVNCENFLPEYRLLNSNSDIDRQDVGSLMSSPLVAGLLAGIPSKLVSLATIYTLKQQQQQQQRVTIPNNAGNCGNGRGKGCNGGGNGGGNGGAVSGTGDANDTDTDDEPKKTMMFFAGRGNIQVKNHNENSDETADESLNKHYTLQVIDEETGVGNFYKDTTPINNALRSLTAKKMRVNKRAEVNPFMVNPIKVNPMRMSLIPSPRKFRFFNKNGFNWFRNGMYGR